MAAPAAVISNRVSAICPAIKAVCRRLPFTLPISRRVPVSYDPADLRLRRLQGRKQAEDDSAQQCQAYAEKQDSEIDVEVGFIGVGVFRAGAGR